MGIRRQSSTRRGPQGRRGGPWTLEEDAVLVRLVSMGMTPAEIARAELPQFSPRAINEKIARMRARGSLPRPEPGTRLLRGGWEWMTQGYDCA